MKRFFGILPVVILSAACGLTQGGAPTPGQSDATPAEGQTRPEERPAELSAAGVAVPAAARTVEEFDTTTPEQRSAAARPEAGRALGRTVASLGSPTEPGFWLKTPLVSEPGRGRVVYPGSGKSSAVELIPIEGPRTAGSQLSLSAMRLIEAPLTGLPEIEVYLTEG